MVGAASSRMVKEAFHKMITMIANDDDERPKTRAQDYAKRLRKQ
jgi:hypothetical protein